MRSLALLGLVLITVTTAGCATIFSESNDSIEVHSDPEGADVYWRGELLGRTPFKHQFKRQTAASYLEFAKKGHEDKRIDLSRTVAPAGWLNFGFLVFSPSSWGTDVSSGAMWEYQPKKYVAKLAPSGGGQETWNERVMEYVLANEKALKNELARGQGETLSSLCRMIKKTPEQCQTFVTRANQERVVANDNSLDLYRALRGIDIGIKVDR